MILQDKETGALVKVLDTVELTDPSKDSISVRIQSGQEEQDPAAVTKETLKFPSGESLPRCWFDANYRQHVAPGSHA